MGACLSKIPIELTRGIVINGQYTTWINVSCGKCVRCIERRKMEWAFRVRDEMKYAKCAYFVTLTYDDKHLPYSPNGTHTLKPEDLTKYFKRLRQTQKRSNQTWEHLFCNLKETDKISYFAAGEYGETRKRPHYHAIIFNASEKNIEKAWGMGSVHCVKATDATITYTMKYLDKSFGSKKSKHKQPEFQRMSEGLGRHYIKKMTHWHKQNLDIQYVMDDRGFKCPMPRIFKQKMFNEDEMQEILTLVAETLETEELEEINRIGLARFNERKSMERKYLEAKFKKAKTKRNID